MHAGSNPTRGFYIHLLVFVLCMVGMAITNYFTGEPYWIVWPLLGWGIGIIAHWWFVLGPGAKRSS